MCSSSSSSSNSSVWCVYIAKYTREKEKKSYIHVKTGKIGSLSRISNLQNCSRERERERERELSFFDKV